MCKKLMFSINVFVLAYRIPIKNIHGPWTSNHRTCLEQPSFKGWEPENTPSKFKSKRTVKSGISGHKRKWARLPSVIFQGLGCLNFTGVMVSKSGVSHFDSIFLEGMVPSDVKLWDDMGSHKGSAQFKIESEQTDSGFFIIITYQPPN